MEARQTDKLFRDKLKHHTLAPSDQAWDRLELILEGKKKSAVWTYRRMAAVGLLLVASATALWIWKLESNDEQPLVAEVATEITDSETSIQPEESPAENQNLPIQAEASVQEEVQVAISKNRGKTIKKTTENKQPIKSEPVEVALKPEAQPMIATSEPIIEASLPTVELQDRADEQPRKQFKHIKITYKRGHTQAQPQEMLAHQKGDSTGGNKLKEFFEQKRHLEPGDLWADIRQAKDNLFQFNGNSKKNNVKNLNK